MSSYPSALSGSRRSVSADRSPPAVSSGFQLFAYLDASNIWLAGSQVSAARRGMAHSAKSAAENRIIDPGFRITFKGLRQFAVGEDTTRAARTVCVGSSKANSDGAIWQTAEHAGWEAMTPQRAKSGREKEVDTTLSVVLLEDLLCSRANPHEVDVTLFSGDRDLLPAVKALRRHGYAVDIACWDHATSAELKLAARRFIALDEYFDLLSYQPQNH